MSTIADQPIPKNLRQQMVDGGLFREKIRLLEVMSKQAEAEEKAGVWNELPEMIRAYRMRNRTGDWLKYKERAVPPSDQ